MIRHVLVILSSLILGACAGPWQLWQPETPERRATTRAVGHQFKNTYRTPAVKPQPVAEKKSLGNIYDEQPKVLLECQSFTCKRDCDPEMMPRPDYCKYYRVPSAPRER